ncbi:hypothetical protein I203_100132 [Kwoniella mangroviensis CBS 8507]|uniref:uncharacterized protein n=1 Tax=Kwoniella mangroviensis CBS 8507 TaxID=1296122 RepID=UPI00080D500C|nr:uncharacterized protein I203_07907 [Kwoniella mangroviensis CBS 8507]OCF62928.1 hypothetical protein I203_07907 [Kwoniella mangroviensis CBS 8507]
MLALALLSLLGTSLNAGVHALPTFSNFTTRQSGESHQVTLVNNCGSGEAVFVHEGNPTASGSQTVSGELKGGLAWMSGMTGTDCADNGLNCGMVEFTLVNSQGGMQNSADYSLLDGTDDELGTSLGNHKYQYSMDFAFTGACTNAPGACTGDSASECPEGFLDSATEGGAPTQCLADNVGITITFCSAGAAPAGSNAASSDSVPIGTGISSAATSPAAEPSSPASVPASVPAGTGTGAPVDSVSTSIPADTGAATTSPLATGVNTVPANGAGSVAEGEPSIAPAPVSSAPAAVTSASSKPAWGGGRGHWTRAVY